MTFSSWRWCLTRPPRTPTPPPFDAPPRQAYPPRPQTLQRLRTLKQGESMRVPRYDKSAHGGRGDRLPESQWPTVTGPIDLVIIEGW